MTVNKRKKNRRGSQTYGWGRKARHRGAGNHSGRGRCGLGKRGHCKKPTMLKLRHEQGLGTKTRVGFKRHAAVKADLPAITLKNLIANIDAYVAQEKAKKDKDMYVVDLRELGFSKLLSNGKLGLRLRVTSDQFSKKAVEKIQAAGGEAIASIPAEEAAAKPEGEAAAEEPLPEESQ